MKIKIILLAAVAAAVVIILFLLGTLKCNRSGPDIIAAVDSVQYWKNMYGQVNASIKQRERDYNRTTAGYLDSIGKLHNTKAKLIKEVMAWRMKGSVVIKEPSKPKIIYKRDTVPGPCVDVDWIEQDFSNAYYKAKAIIPIQSEFQSELSIETYDTLRAVVKTVNEGPLLNRRQYLQVDVVNTNPYNRISGLQVYRKPLPKPKRIGIGLQVGYGLNNELRPVMYAGVGISYNLIRL